MLRRIAEIPTNAQQGSIRCLSIVDDESSPGAVFLCEHESLEEPYVFDTWCESLQIALDCAKDRWGLAEDSWRNEETP